MSHAADWKRWRKRGIPLADDLLGPPHASSTMEPWMMEPSMSPGLTHSVIDARRYVLVT